MPVPKRKPLPRRFANVDMTADKFRKPCDQQSLNHSERIIVAAILNQVLEGAIHMPIGQHGWIAAIRRQAVECSLSDLGHLTGARSIAMAVTHAAYLLADDELWGDPDSA